MCGTPRQTSICFDRAIVWRTVRAVSDPVEPPEYAAGDEYTVIAMANARGEHGSETFPRMSLETHGKAWFTPRMFNPGLKALAYLFQSEHGFPSLGGAGAHVSRVMDAGWADFVLSHWKRTAGLFSMGQAIRRLTSVPARVTGLKDRGILAPEIRADVNVSDAAKAAERQPELVNDFPGGAPRFIQRSHRLYQGVKKLTLGVGLSFPSWPGLTGPPGAAQREPMGRFGWPARR